VYMVVDVCSNWRILQLMLAKLVAATVKLNKGVSKSMLWMVIGNQIGLCVIGVSFNCKSKVKQIL